MDYFTYKISDVVGLSLEPEHRIGGFVSAATQICPTCSLRLTRNRSKGTEKMHDPTDQVIAGSIMPVGAAYMDPPQF